MENNNLKFLFKLGFTWTWSKVYYDKSRDSFIEEKYHEEYLDTGTICDGEFPITDEELWKRIVEEANETGASEYLKIRGKAPELHTVKTEMNYGRFVGKLHEIKQEKPYRKYKQTKYGSTIVISDEKSNILGVVSKTNEFWVYIDPTIEAGAKGFYTEEETLEYAINKIKQLHERRIANDKPQTIKPPQPTPVTPTKKKWFGFKKD